MRVPVVVSSAVEGVVDEAVARRLIIDAGAEAGPVYGKNGKNSLRNRIAGYTNAARHAPWVVLVDLDAEECAPPMRAAWVSQQAPRLCFRIAVREVEAWLMADGAMLARFLGVAVRVVPLDPEALEDPKAVLVRLAAESRYRAIRQDMVPREAAGRRTGPAYTSRMIEYVSAHWRPEVAAERSDSLRRAINCLDRLVREEQAHREGNALR